MYYEGSGSGPEPVVLEEANYVRNEVVLTTVQGARNDDHPHYLSVAAGAPPSRGYDDPSIDGILARLGVGDTSVSRVYLPRTTAAEMSTAASATAFDVAGITADYDPHESAGGLERTYRVAFAREVDVYHVCEALRGSKAVEDASPNYVYEAQIRPTDRFYGFQWGPPAINCEQAWDIEQGHPDVRIAVVDSGVDLGHDDLQPKLLTGRDFVDLPQGAFGPRYLLQGDHQTRDPDPDDEDGHGSHCAGIAAAVSNNGRGVAGVCWAGGILPVRVMCRVYDQYTHRSTSMGSTTDIAAGIKFAIDSGAHVVNLSLSGSRPSYSNVLDYAYDRNVAVIAATGNQNTSEAGYPAANPKVLAVGAIDQNLNRAAFSNYGPNYNRFVMAPGVRIASCYKDSSYVYLQGTSMAAPFVTGVAGLMVSLALRASQTLPVADIYNIIRDTAVNLGQPYFCGEGLVNAEAALEATQSWSSGNGGAIPSASRSARRRKRKS